MKKISFSRAAHADILDIGRYTEENWGIKQRNLYIEKLFVAFDNLCKSPNLGKPYDEVSAGMRAFHSEKHVIYYFVKEKDLYVAGVLHENMLPELRF
jgi:toxin ParE1/3/4